MKWLILLFFSLSSILFFIALLNSLFFTNKRLQRRMVYYLITQGDKALDKKKFSFLLQIKLYNERLKRKIPIGKSMEKLEINLNRAGVSLTPQEFVFFRWIFTLLLSGMMYLFLANGLGLFIGLIFGYITPHLIIQRKQQRRLQKFNDGLPDMITVIVGSLKAGLSFPQSLKTVVEESGSPIQEEIDLILKDMQYGNSLEDALNHLQERVSSSDLEIMIQAILIQRQVGGNLATVLETIVQTIRDRNHIQRQVTTLTAQGRLSGMVIGSLPIVLGIVIYFISPDYIGSLFNHPIGKLLIGAGALLGTIGFILIRKLTTIEV